MKTVLEDLRRFFWEGVREGMAMDLYVWPYVAPIGNVTVLEFQPDHVHVAGIFGVLPVDLDLRLLDEDARGHCLFTVKPLAPSNCIYESNEAKITVSGFPLSAFSINARDKNWTWIQLHQIGGMWIGAWPRGMAIEAGEIPHI